MKTPVKILFVLSVLFYASTFALPFSGFAGSEAASYARIETEGAVLYGRDEDTDTFFSVTTLPRTHFVRVIEEYDDEYFAVSYRDLTGFIQKPAVQPVDFEPLVKDAAGFLTVTADVSAIPLRLLPDHEADNIAGQIEKGEILSYYGSASGSSVLPGGSAMWYYVLFEPDGEEPVRGYVYSAYVTADPIPLNSGEAVPAPVTEDPQPDPDPEAPSVPSAPAFVRYLAIAALTVPAAVIMILLFQKPKEGRKRRMRKEKPWG